MRAHHIAYLAAIFVALSASVPVRAQADLKLPRESVTLVAPPFVHAHEQVAKSGPKIIEFKMTVVEKPIVIDEAGTTIPGLTYNGSIPGPLMVVHEGDYVELTLVNPATNTMTHTIDFHAATGALGGAALMLVNPGEQAVLRWKATRAGAHLSLRTRRVDDAVACHIGHERGDFYVPRGDDGKFQSFTDASDFFPKTPELMRKLVPTHVVFEGKVGALTGKNALQAKVGETVLIVHSQANRDSRPHLIGRHGDYVWETGSFHNPPERDLQTWFTRGGRSRSLYFSSAGHLRLPQSQSHRSGGTWRNGAHFKVEGQWNLMKQMSPPQPIVAVEGPGGKSH